MSYYIAYGSNLNLPQMLNRCPYAHIVGVGTLEGWRLMFKGSKSGSYLTIEPCDDGEVPVAIWETTWFDEKRLDIYEGYPDFYYKKRLKVDCMTKDGPETLTAYVYIMREERPYGVPSTRYMETCADGYRYFGFDTEALEDAYFRSWEEVSGWQ